MSWLDKLLPPKIKQTDPKSRKGIPEGLWIKCPSCEAVLYRNDVEANLHVCPKCSHHMRIGARERLDGLLDPEGRYEIGQEVAAGRRAQVQGQPQVPGSPERGDGRHRRNRRDGRHGRRDPHAAGRGGVLRVLVHGRLDGLGGRRALRARRANALEQNVPFICFTASGGARMQESLLSLMQMAKTTALLTKLSDAKLPFISVLTDPTMGGVSASFAFLGDVVIAEPKALIGFAGPRVIEQTVREKLPEGFQRAEFLLQKGAIDMIVDRRKMREELAQLMALLTRQPADSVA